ncbi:MAG TPA: CocE/NonD family hydrolase [Conexibacter sp.]|nr:CocE/NonD family hydrolase [Conexibacter sp.]
MAATNSAGSTLLVEKNVMVPMRDGVALATDVYRPRDATGLPVLLERTPYDKELSALRNGTIEVLRAVQAGYAVVVQDTRGRFASEGRFDPYADDDADGADTIEWVARQPWCSGAVGMIGGSYFGATQWRAASAAGTALKAIAPVVAADDFHHGWTYQGGAFQLGFSLHWTLAYLAFGEAVRRQRAGEDAAAELDALIEALDHDDAWYERTPLAELPLLAELAPYYGGWLAHPSYDAHWQALAPKEHHPRIAAPALNVGGWFDIFLGGTLANYVGMRARGATDAARRPKLVVGPWAHGNLSGVYPNRGFGFRSHYVATDPTALHLRWFDRHLRGIENGIDDEPPVRIFVMGADEWRDEQDWPLPDTDYRPLYLHSGGRANTTAGDGSLAFEAPAGDEPADAYAYDPRDPVRTVGGATVLPGQAISLNAGPLDQAPLAERADVLTYVTPPLERDVEVIGPVSLVLFASSSALDTDFTGKLIDVHPDGSTQLLTDGILRARYRDSPTHAELLEPGRIYKLHVDLVATANVFRAGHRIRLDVSSSNFPRFDRNTNTGGTIATERIEDAVVAENRVHHDAAHPSHLLLPVIERT